MYSKIHGQVCEWVTHIRLTSLPATSRHLLCCACDANDGFEKQRCQRSAESAIVSDHAAQDACDAADAPDGGLQKHQLN